MELVDVDPAEGDGRSHESLVRSLAELRAIEVQRQTEEQAAIAAALQARRREREAAAQAARDAEAARQGAALDAELAVERARADAERDARLRIEAIEAAERARRLIALEEQRMTAELAVRREAALRQRPRGLIALTAVALAAAAGLGWLALDRAEAAAGARAARDHALATVDRAEHATDEARRALDQTARDLAALRAQFDAVRRAAPPAAPAPAADARPAPARAPHGRTTTTAPPAPPPVHLSDDCLRTPLCDVSHAAAAPAPPRRI